MCCLPAKLYEQQRRQQLCIRRVLDVDDVHHRHTGCWRDHDSRVGVHRRERVAQKLFSRDSDVGAAAGGVVFWFVIGERIAGQLAGDTKATSRLDAQKMTPGLRQPVVGAMPASLTRK